MRIARLMSDIQFNNEERQQLFQRKEMDAAYKRNAKYNASTKKQMLKILDELLSKESENNVMTNLNSLVLDEQQSVKKEMQNVKETIQEVDFVSEDIASFTNRDTYSKQGASVLKQVFQKAVSNYAFQMEMAAKGFVMEQPRFSSIA